MSYFIEQNTIEEIKDRADIVDVVGRYVDLKRSGNNYKGLCPFHSEKTPSFTVSPQKGIYKCFGCGESGTAINFVMKMDNISFPEACRKLAGEYGIKIEESKSVDTQVKKLKDEMYSINRETGKIYISNLRKSRQAYKYLKNRGIDDDIIKKFGLGYSNDSWDQVLKYLEANKFDLNNSFKAGVLGKTRDGRYIDYFRNRIMFPIINSKSLVIGFGARSLDNSLPKYLNTADSLIFNKGKNLYGVNLLNRNIKQDYVILVEGYMDVISLYSNGVKNALASLGTSLTYDQVRILKQYTDNLYISYDGDEAGINATKRALEIIHNFGWNAKVIVLEGGMDPDDYIRKYGKSRYDLMMKNALDGYTFLIEDYKKNLDLNNSDDKFKLISYIGTFIEKLPSSLEKELKINELSKEFNISEDSLKEYILNNRGKDYKSSGKISRELEDKKRNDKTQRSINEIFRLMLNDTDFLELFSKKLKKEDLEGVNLEIFSSIINNYDDNEDFNKELLLNYLLENRIINEKFKNELSSDIDNYHIKDKELLSDELIKTITDTENKEKKEDIIEKIKRLESKPNLSEEERVELNTLLISLM